MGDVVHIRKGNSEGVEAAMKTVNQLLSEGGIDEIVCVMRNADGTNTQVFGVVNHRWNFVGFLEEVKQWLLSGKEESSSDKVS